MNESSVQEPSRLLRRRLPLRLQADLLGRLAITLRAGIDLRKAWANEVPRLPARWRSRLAVATQALGEGEMLSEALRRTGLFSPLVLGMVAVGDQTGRDVDTLRELSQVLSHTVQTSRQLRASLVWPGMQLCLALLVVGLLIFLGGMMETGAGQTTRLHWAGAGGGVWPGDLRHLPGGRCCDARLRLSPAAGQLAGPWTGSADPQLGAADRAGGPGQ